MDPKRPLRVVVTGGSRGIGRACVDAFLSDPHRRNEVLFSYRTTAPREEKSPSTKAARLDLGDYASVQSFVKEVDAWRCGELSRG